MHALTERPKVHTWHTLQQHAEANPYPVYPGLRLTHPLHLKLLDPVQNADLCLAVGAFRTSPAPEFTPSLTVECLSQPNFSFP